MVAQGKHPPIVVLVHNRAEALRRLLRSVRRAEGADMSRVTIYQVCLGVGVSVVTVCVCVVCVCVVCASVGV